MSSESKSSITQLCLSPSWGGLEMAAIKHALWFREQGHPVSGVCLKDSPLEEAFSKVDIPHLSLTKRGYFSFEDSLKLRKFLKEQKTKTVFCHHLKDLWRLRLSVIGLKNIQIIGFARMFLKDVNKKDFLHRFVYGRMETLVSLTEIQKQALLNCLPVKAENVAVIPDPVNTDVFNPAQRSEEYRRSVYGLGEGGKAIGLVGRIDPQKGSREFIEAAISLLRKHPHLKFFLVGKETPDTPGFEKKLKDYVSSKGAQDHIIFLGHRTDVEKIIANLDLFVMPSYEETFGDVLIEAMACQIPSIATRAGGPINIIDDKENGLLVPPKEVKPLEEAMEKLITDQKFARDLANKAKKKALQVYAEPKVFEAISALLR